jgi:adenosine/AMP kinase
MDMPIYTTSALVAPLPPTTPTGVSNATDLAAAITTVFGDSQIFSVDEMHQRIGFDCPKSKIGFMLRALLSQRVIRITGQRPSTRPEARKRKVPTYVLN